MPTPDRTDADRAAMAEKHARAWIESYGIRTESYTRSGGDHPMMDTLPAAMLAFAAALRGPRDRGRAARDAAAAMRKECLREIEAHTYRGQGTEGRNDLIGMFARGQMRCKQALLRKICALPIPDPSAQPETGSGR